MKFGGIRNTVFGKNATRPPTRHEESHRERTMRSGPSPLWPCVCVDACMSVMPSDVSRLLSPPAHPLRAQQPNPAPMRDVFAGPRGSCICQPQCRALAHAGRARIRAFDRCLPLARSPSDRLIFHLRPLDDKLGRRHHGARRMAD